MSGRIKPTTAFRILNANRKAKKRFEVVALTKAGKPSKARICDLSRAATAEEAEKIQARLEKFNPGQRFIVIDREDGANETSRNE